jgi:uncharacterized protein DUF4136
MQTAPLTRALAVAIVCAVGTALPSAQKIDIDVKRDEKADFASLRTYAWLPTPPAKRDIAPDAVTNPNMTQEVLGPHIVAAVDRELTARGLKQADAGEADVKVVYYAALEVGINASQLGSYYQYTTGWGYPVGTFASVSSDVYERGSVVIDVVRRDTNVAIWRGSAATNVNHENTPEKRVKRIDDAVARMFEKFPVPRSRKR